MACHQPATPGQRLNRLEVIAVSNNMGMRLALKVTALIREKELSVNEVVENLNNFFGTNYQPSDITNICIGDIAETPFELFMMLGKTLGQVLIPEMEVPKESDKYRSLADALSSMKKQRTSVFSAEVGKSVQDVIANMKLPNFPGYTDEQQLSALQRLADDKNAPQTVRDMARSFYEKKASEKKEDNKESDEFHRAMKNQLFVFIARERFENGTLDPTCCNNCKLAFEKFSAEKEKEGLGISQEEFDAERQAAAAEIEADNANQQQTLPLPDDLSKPKETLTQVNNDPLAGIPFDSVSTEEPTLK